jgi:hypothetical protein
VGVRGGADQPGSWAARVRRGAGDGLFHATEGGEGEEVPGRCSAARGLAGAGRCRSATEAAVNGFGAARREEKLERTREDGLHSAICRE